MTPAPRSVTTDRRSIPALAASPAMPASPLRAQFGAHAGYVKLNDDLGGGGLRLDGPASRLGSGRWLNNDRLLRLGSLGFCLRDVFRLFLDRLGCIREDDVAVGHLARLPHRPARRQRRARQ